MRRELEKRIKKQRAELEAIDRNIAELQTKKAAAQAVLSELDSLVKTLGKEEDEPDREKQIRFGTDVYKAREVLRIWGKPLYIDKIITVLGEMPTDARRRSLASQLAAYVRENQIFTRPAPNTFGLKEFENQKPEMISKNEPDAGIDFSHLNHINDESVEKKGGAIQGEMPDFPF